MVRNIKATAKEAEAKVAGESRKTEPHGVGLANGSLTDRKDPSQENTLPRTGTHIVNKRTVTKASMKCKKEEFEQAETVNRFAEHLCKRDLKTRKKPPQKGCLTQAGKYKIGANQRVGASGSRKIGVERVANRAWVVR